MEDKICCITGHRPQSFPWDYDNDTERKKIYLARLYDETKKLIDQGYNYFISGGAIGVDMDFADTVLELKNIYKDIKLEIAVPCADQDKKWKKKEKEHYQHILDVADNKIIMFEHFTNWCMHKRNEYMVDKSELVLAFWNGIESGGTYNTIKYALKKNKEVRNFYFEIP